MKSCKRASTTWTDLTSTTTKYARLALLLGANGDDAMKSQLEDCESSLASSAHQLNRAMQVLMKPLVLIVIGH